MSRIIIGWIRIIVVSINPYRHGIEVEEVVCHVSGYCGVESIISCRDLRDTGEGCDQVDPEFVIDNRRIGGFSPHGIPV